MQKTLAEILREQNAATVLHREGFVAGGYAGVSSSSTKVFSTVAAIFKKREAETPSDEGDVPHLSTLVFPTTVVFHQTGFRIYSSTKGFIEQKGVSIENIRTEFSKIAQGAKTGETIAATFTWTSDPKYPQLALDLSTLHKFLSLIEEKVASFRGNSENFPIQGVLQVVPYQAKPLNTHKASQTLFHRITRDNGKSSVGSCVYQPNVDLSDSQYPVSLDRVNARRLTIAARVIQKSICSALGLSDSNKFVSYFATSESTLWYLCSCAPSKEVKGLDAPDNGTLVASRAHSAGDNAPPLPVRPGRIIRKKPEKSAPAIPPRRRNSARGEGNALEARLSAARRLRTSSTTNISKANIGEEVALALDNTPVETACSVPYKNRQTSLKLLLVHSQDGSDKSTSQRRLSSGSDSAAIGDFPVQNKRGSLEAVKNGKIGSTNLKNPRRITNRRGSLEPAVNGISARELDGNKRRVDTKALLSQPAEKLLPELKLVSHRSSSIRMQSTGISNYKSHSSSPLHHDSIIDGQTEIAMLHQSSLQLSPSLSLRSDSNFNGSSRSYSPTQGRVPGLSSRSQHTQTQSPKFGSLQRARRSKSDFCRLSLSVPSRTFQVAKSPRRLSKLNLSNSPRQVKSPRVFSPSSLGIEPKYVPKSFKASFASALASGLPRSPRNLQPLHETSKNPKHIKLSKNFEGSQILQGGLKKTENDSTDFRGKMNRDRREECLSVLTSIIDPDRLKTLDRKMFTIACLRCGFSENNISEECEILFHGVNTIETYWLAERVFSLIPASAISPLVFVQALKSNRAHTVRQASIECVRLTRHIAKMKESTSVSIVTGAVESLLALTPEEKKWLAEDIANSKESSNPMSPQAREVKESERLLNSRIFERFHSSALMMTILAIQQTLVDRVRISSETEIPSSSNEWKGTFKVVNLIENEDETAAVEEELRKLTETMGVCYVSQVDNIEYTHPMVRKTGLITHSGVLIETRFRGEIKFQTVVDLIEVESQAWCAVRHYRQVMFDENWDDVEKMVTYYRPISFDQGKKPWSFTMKDGQQAPVRFAVWRGTDGKKLEEIHKEWVEKTRGSMMEMTKGQFNHITGNCQHAAAYAVNNIKLKAEGNVPGLGATPSAKPPNAIFRLFVGTKSWRPELSKGHKRTGSAKIKTKKTHTKKDPKTPPRATSPDGFSSNQPLPLPLSKIPELIASLKAADTGLDIRDRNRRMHLGKHRQCFLGNGFCDWVLYSGWATDRAHGVLIGEFLRELGLITEVHDEHKGKPFEDSSGRFYRFVNESITSNRNTSSVRLSSAIGSTKSAQM